MGMREPHSKPWIWYRRHWAGNDWVLQCALPFPEGAKSHRQLASFSTWRKAMDAALAHVTEHSAQRARAERAEAEAANLEADYDRRGERLWRLAVKAGHAPSESDNDASAEHSVASALAERDDFESRLSLLLCELTDGRMSESGYDVPTMVREVESTFETHAELDRADVVAERDALATTGSVSTSWSRASASTWTTCSRPSTTRRSSHEPQDAAGRHLPPLPGRTPEERQAADGGLMSDREVEVSRWLRDIGINPGLILMREGHCIVTPRNEGELDVNYRTMHRDKDGRLILGQRGEDIPTHPARIVTPVPPPGFRLPEWDAVRWLHGDYDQEDS